MPAAPPLAPCASRRGRAAVLGALLTLTLLAAPVAAQSVSVAETPWRAAVIVSATGAGELGQRHAFSAERSVASLAAAGVYGQRVLIDVFDDAGDPRRAEALAREALHGGALALVCCTTAAATDRVARLAEEHGALLLALDAARPAEAAWVLQLAPTPRTTMTAAAVHAAVEGKAALALLTLDTPFGDDAEHSFELALVDTGRANAGVVRYEASATVLTPEGLQVAAREPGSVIAWGLPADTLLALDGLRGRGYLGIVYVRPGSLPNPLWRRLLPLEPYDLPILPAREDPYLGVRLAVPPVAMHGALAPSHPNASAVAAFLTRAGGTPAVDRSDAVALVDLARVDDAVQLLRLGFEGVAELGLPPGRPVVSLRLALRDVLLSAAPFPLAAGTYAPRAGETRAAHWRGLVVVVVGERALP